MKKISIIIIAIFSAVILTAAEDKPKEKTAAEYIKDLKADNDEKSIVTAAEWLGKEKKKDAIPQLVSLLNDSRENVRLNTVVALGYIGEEKGCLDGLHKVLLNDESAIVRYAALLATFRIGSKNSIDTWEQSKKKESDPDMQDFLNKMFEKAKK